jgi:hypothetical protein
VYQKENGEFHIKRISFKSDMGINQFDVMYSDYFLKKAKWMDSKQITYCLYRPPNYPRHVELQIVAEFEQDWWDRFGPRKLQ